ncbi:zinc finger and BTB domain-containing protein 17-like [Cylas formicarius]|uniref:zinc finger and BTB domain-containing protein 17-like n=1 Tax=Cylas formicarius TaxID=197179 RepID=UPI0029587B28|nr:zinc finger and BTB domain-containing protein 17-like [Cylas formicarius]
METAEQFSLCWNNFHSNLSTGFHSLLRDENFVDVTLAAEGRFMKAHKTVLSVCSPFFKQLFMVNPCEHPIVILPDVDYNALRSVLHFMYQGEVSVSQEEISSFMRVAEVLRVKGLTDNASEGANGFVTSPRGCFDSIGEVGKLKRPRLARKLSKAESPKPTAVPQKSTLGPLLQSPPPPPLLKREVCMETPPCVSPGPQMQALPLVKPKDEPPDHVVEEEEKVSKSSGDEMNMDIANMLDTSLGESSQQGAQWTTQDPDCGQTGSTMGLVLLKSGKGQLVLVHNGHMYTYSDTRQNRMLWVCVKKKTLNCRGSLTTLRGPVLLTVTGHNHPQMHDVIKRLQVPRSEEPKS